MHHQPEFNEHHGVPRSFLGSTERANLSVVEVHEHDRFHTMAGHLPPDFFLRRLILSTVSHRDQHAQSVPSAAYRDLLAILMRDDWHSLYIPQAFRSTEHPQNGELIALARASVHLHSSIVKEQEFVADAIRMVFFGRSTTPEIEDFRDGAMDFFRSSDLESTTTRFLNDKNHKGDYKWTKSLRRYVRRDILNVFKNLRLVRPDDAYRRDMFTILRDQAGDLAEAMIAWNPNIFSSDHQDALPLPQIKRHKKAGME